MNFNRKLSDRVKDLIFLGAEMTRDIEMTYSYIEELLTPSEAKIVEDFLNWCIENSKTFGRKNINVVYQEYLESSN